MERFRVCVCFVVFVWGVRPPVALAHPSGFKGAPRAQTRSIDIGCVRSAFVFACEPPQFRDVLPRDVFRG